MIPAVLPANEHARLKALRQLNLLDTPLEERFERITRLACRLLNVRHAAFTLIDKERQWFKSLQNHHAIETPRDLAFCAHTILEDDVLIVPDMLKDARFADNPFVTGETNINFYAGCPVRSPDGEKIGTICAMDTKAQELDPSQVQVLRDLARLAETELRVSSLSAVQSQLITELETSLRLSMIDQQTRLWNRRGLHEMLKREWAEALRNNKHIALALVEIDQFQSISGTYGDSVAAAMAKALASRIMTYVRVEDIVGRFADNQLLLIMHECDADNLHKAVERVRSNATQQPVTIESVRIKTTLTFGATIGAPSELSSFELYLEAVETALATARQNGRDRTEISLPGYL